MLGNQALEKGVETDACCVFLVGSSLQRMENERMKGWGVSWLRGDGIADGACTHSVHNACIQ